MLFYYQFPDLFQYAEVAIFIPIRFELERMCWTIDLRSMEDDDCTTTDNDTQYLKKAFIQFANNTTIIILIN